MNNFVYRPLVPVFAESPEFSCLTWWAPPGPRNWRWRSRKELWRRIWFVTQDIDKTHTSSPLILSCQGLFKKIADATGESLESVCQMQEAERNGLVEALMLEQVCKQCFPLASCSIILLGGGKRGFSWLWKCDQTKKVELWGERGQCISGIFYYRQLELPPPRKEINITKTTWLL